MYAQGTPATVGEYLKIAASLRCFHDPECKLLAGNRKVGTILARDLQEHARVRTALVSLAGGVQKARTKSETGRHVFLVANRDPHALQRLFVRLVHFHVPEQSEVIARLDSIQVRAQVSSERP